MRMQKCHLAITPMGHHITAEDAVSTGPRVWSCIHCGCGLILHAGSKQESTWFEHDQRNVANKVLMGCSYLDPGVKDDARQRKLKLMLTELEPAPLVLSWHCVLCGSDYDGEKCCMTCGSGIYSTERNLALATV